MFLGSNSNADEMMEIEPSELSKTHPMQRASSPALSGSPSHGAGDVRPKAPSRINSTGPATGTTVACVVCRKKKIKCDSAKPSCSQCQADGIACRYVEWKKTGLPRGYVRKLEAQIKQLKIENEELRARQGLQSGSQPFAHHELPLNIPLSTPSDEIHPSFLPDQSSPLIPSDYDSLMQDPLEIARLAIADLLTPVDQKYLRDLYFSACHPFVPIVHEPTFDITEGDTHVILGVFALACRHSDNFRHRAEIFYSLAKQTTQATFMSPDLSTLVALLLQAVYEIGHPNTSVHCAATIGAALSLSSAFRLVRMDEEQADNRNLWLDKPRDWIEEETRRRVFLMILSISRWSATIQQRELGFPVKREISVFLPVSDAVWFGGGPSRPRTDPITMLERCSSAGPFARFVQTLGLYARVNDFNQCYPFREASENGEELCRIDALIQNFVTSFPRTWQDPLLDGENLLDPTTLALAHCASLLLHHPIVHKYRKDRNNRSSKRCSASAEDILDIIHVIQNHPKVGNYMLPHPLVIAARVRLLELLEQKGHYRGRDMDLVINALHSLGKNWGMQEKLADHAAKMESNKMLFGEPLTTFEPKTEVPVPRQKAAALLHPRILEARARLFTLPGNVNESVENGSAWLLDPFLSSDIGMFSNDIFNWPTGSFVDEGHMGESQQF